MIIVVVLILPLMCGMHSACAWVCNRANCYGRKTLIVVLRVDVDDDFLPRLK